MVYILEDSGKLISGNRIIDYRPGHLIFVPSNLPQRFLSNSDYNWAKSIIIHVTPDIINSELLSTSYFQPLKNPLKSTAKVYIHNSIDEPTANIIKQLTNNNKNMLSCAIRLLERISSSYIVNHVDIDFQHELKNKKISSALTWLQSNYKRDITLKEIAKYLNMDTSTFCRQFKKGLWRISKSNSNQSFVRGAAKPKIV